MPDTDTTSLFYAWQTSRTAAVVNPIFRSIDNTGPNVTVQNRTVQSQALDPTRNVRDVKSVGLDVSAAIPVEFAYGNADPWIEAVFGGTWAVNARALPTAITSNTATVPAGTGTAFKKGMVVRGSGFSVASNNGLFVLTADGGSTSVTVTGMVAETPPAGAAIKAVGFQALSGEMSIQQTNGVFRLVMASTSGSFLGLLAPGEFFYIGGRNTIERFDNLAIGAYPVRVAPGAGSVTAQTVILDIVGPGFGTDAGSGKTIRLSIGDVLDQGTTRRYMTLQRRIANLFGGVTGLENTIGQELASMRINLAAQDIAKIDFNLMGDGAAYPDLQFSGATDFITDQREVMATAADLGMLVLNGAQVGSVDDYFQSLDLTFDNQLRQRAALGVYGYAGRGQGKFLVSGNASMYLGDLTMAKRALLNQDNQFAFAISDTLGATMLCDLPAFKVSGTPSTPATGQDAMMPLTITARRHSGLGYTARFHRFDERL